MSVYLSFKVFKVIKCYCYVCLVCVCVEIRGHLLEVGSLHLQWVLVVEYMQLGLHGKQFYWLRYLITPNDLFLGDDAGC